MDLKKLLDKLDLLEGTMKAAEKHPTGPKFTGKWKGTDKGLPGKKLVGDSVEPQENILKDLSRGPTPKSREQELSEEFEAFLQALEEENLGVENKRPARKGARPSREYTSDEKPSKRYKTIKEDAVGDGEEANAVVAEVMQLISDGHTEVSPDVIIAKVSAALGRPFMLKDLVATNNASPELQHYISSINPTKIKFSTDILTVKNQDPAKEKERAEAGVANMAARAANRPRLGEGRDQGISKSAETKFHKKLDTLVHDTFGKRKEEMKENAEELNVGDDVVITGPVEHQGETGVIDSFGQDKRFVIVNLYNHGKRSFHSSDVSFNDYADSDAEEAEMYDRDPDFRKWADTQVDEAIDPVTAGVSLATGLAAPLAHKAGQKLGKKIGDYMDKRAAKKAKQKKQVGEDWDSEELSPQELSARTKAALAAHDEATADYGSSHGFGQEFSKKSLKSALNRKYGILKALKDKSLPLAKRLQFKELLRDVEREIEDLQVAESKRDPHKIIANKLKDIERSKNPPAELDLKSREAQAKAEYRKYVEKMKKKNPDYVPLYKMDEAGANNPPQQNPAGTTPTTTTPQQQQQAKNVAQATQTLKAATGSTVPNTTLAKAIDAASQGKAVDTTSMKALEPIMKDVAAVASDPKLANQFKSLASQINQTQQKQVQQKS